MASDEALTIVRRGPEAWNQWRGDRENADLDLSGADLRGANLAGINFNSTHLADADLSDANLAGAELFEAYLRRTTLDRANLTDALLEAARLIEASLDGACLRGALFTNASLHAASLKGADLRGVCIARSDLSYANLSGCDLRGGELLDTVLREADLSQANLEGADLSRSSLVETVLTGANLAGCRIYGISAWNLELTGTVQRDLVINRDDAPAIVVDDVEVAQFVYLLLHNDKIRKVIDTVTSKAVLLLGRFSATRKPLLDALRTELRHRGYAPILFDFERPADRDITETVTLLARMARFIVADLTDASSLPKELEAIVPGLAVPVQPLLQEDAKAFAMFRDHWKYDWVLPVHRYRDTSHLLAEVAAAVIEPSERKVRELAQRRAAAFGQP